MLTNRYNDGGHPLATVFVCLLGVVEVGVEFRTKLFEKGLNLYLYIAPPLGTSGRYSTWIDCRYNQTHLLAYY